MKKMIKYLQENTHPLFMIDTMRILRIVLLMSMFAIALMVSGCVTSMDEGIEFVTLDADIALPETEDDIIENNDVIEISGNDYIVQENENNDFDADQADTTLLMPTSSCFPSSVTTPTVIAKEFLSQFVSIFFGPYSDEPAILVSEGTWDDRGGWSHYFMDGRGDVISDVPFIQTLGLAWFDGGTSLGLAHRFRLFTLNDSAEPLVIAMQYESLDLSGGGYALYEIISNGEEFLRLGTIIGYGHFGAGHDAVSLIPFINESGYIIAYVISDGGEFFAINSEGNFESVACINAHWRSEDGDTIIITVEDEDGTWHYEWLTQEEFEELMARGQMQSFFPNFPDGNFVRMERMYDLEQEFTEAITQRLRGTFPVVVRPNK